MLLESNETNVSFASATDVGKRSVSSQRRRELRLAQRRNHPRTLRTNADPLAKFPFPNLQESALNFGVS